MATIEIPESLRAYYDNKAVRRAVDELVGKLDGADMPDCDWSEAENYNKALSMAAQVRTDYVALLFRVWDVTFGKSDPQRLRGQYFSHEYLSPKLIWEYRWLWRSYYRDGNPDAGGRRDDLSVFLREDSLELRVHRYGKKEELNGSGIPTVEGWSTQHDDVEGGPCLANQGVKMREFFSDTDAVMDRFAKDAAKVIQTLLET